MQRSCCLLLSFIANQYPIAIPISQSNSNQFFILSHLSQLSSQTLLSKAFFDLISYALQVTMEISNSENLQQTEHRDLSLSHLNYVDGISADNNAEFEFLRIKRKQSVHC